MNKDPMLELLDEAIAARSNAVILSRREQRESLITDEFDSAFAAELADVYAESMPPESIRKLFARLFEGFCDWLRPDGVPALPAAGAVVGDYLIYLALNGRSQIKETAAAICWFHKIGGYYWDEERVQTAFKVIAKLHSDDGGGGESLPAGNIIMSSGEMPMAAGSP
jgi:hypothetical protein